MIELVIVMTIAAIMLTLAIPSLRGVLTRNQLRAQTTETSTALSLARSEAITRGTNAGVCASSDGSTCSGSAGDFGKYLIVFADSDSDSALDVGEPVIKILNGHSKVTQTADAAAYFFRPSGFRTVNGNATVSLCNPDLTEQDQCRQIAIAPSGAIAVTTHTGS